MSTTPQEPPPIAVKRPALVWVISIFYILSAGWVVLSFALIHSGAIPLNEAQQEYFRSQTILDYGSTVVIGALNLVGAILLFLLKKPAFHLFATAFGVGLAFTAYQIVAKNWLGAIGGPGLVGAVIGWGISIAIIVYAKRLISRGVLR
jgi:hypothetical protein